MHLQSWLMGGILSVESGDNVLDSHGALVMKLETSRNFEASGLGINVIEYSQYTIKK